jgi:hypothetical protein
MKEILLKNDILSEYLPRGVGIKEQIPTILIKYILPFILVSYVIKLFLDRIRFFHSPLVNLLISILISAATLFPTRFLIISESASYFIIGISLLPICIFNVRGFKGIMLGIGVIIVYFIFVLPFLIKLSL